MQVNTNLNTVSPQAAAKADVPRRTRSDTVQVRAFDRAVALSDALHTAPEIRADAVKRARELVSSPDYPSPATIAKIGELLASHLVGAASP